MGGFGQHLMLDGYDCNPNLLQDLGLIYNFLDECPERIKMTKIMPPYVFKYEGIKPEDWGISGFVLIAESHISIHTFPEKKYLRMELFSCKKFDLNDTISYLKETFQMTRYEHNLINRGNDFPRHVTLAKNFVAKDRLKIIGSGK
jgi:S-adenosylmethionine decarboxylase